MPAFKSDPKVKRLKIGAHDFVEITGEATGLSSDQVVTAFFQYSVGKAARGVQLAWREDVTGGYEFHGLIPDPQGVAPRDTPVTVRISKTLSDAHKADNGFVQDKSIKVK